MAHLSMSSLMGKLVDLMQVHNLVDARMHLATLTDWKAAGRVRYVGSRTTMPAPTPSWNDSSPAAASISCR
jgi:hypothetical protein